MKTYRNNGFTLIELMITIGIVAITMAIGLPSMSEFIKNERLTTENNTLVGHLQLARSEAMSKHQQVVVCPSTDNATCSGTSWQDGWIVFKDDDADGDVSAGETVLKAKSKIKSDVKINNSGGAKVIYDPRGFAPNSDSTFSICDDRGAGNGKSLSIGKTGRLRKGGSVSC